MKFISTLIFIGLLSQAGNPQLDQDVIFLKAPQEKAPPGESFEVITEKNLLKAKDILQKYWKENESLEWTKFNRQYMIYNTNHSGKLVVVEGVCLEKPAEYFQTVWCFGMSAEKCYYMAYINLKKKTITKFDWMTYDKK